jgi:hypothetical protein
MKASVTGTALLLALLASACGGAPGDRIASACIESGEMSEEACSCLGEKADTELSDEQKATLVELIESADEQTTEPTAEQFELAFFLAGAAVECQGGELFGN